MWKKMLLLAWPLIIANGFWTLQMTIDRLFLSNYSTVALGAAVGVLGVFWAPMALLQQTAGYVTTFVAQYTGAKKPEMVGASFWQAIYVSLVGGLLFYTLVLVSETFFNSLGHSPEITKYEIAYFNALAHSALPTAIVGAISGYFMGLGKTQLILWINGAGLLINAAFDYLLIFGTHGFPAMGIEGAGYATAIATWASVFVGLSLLYFVKSDEVASHKLLETWKFKPEMIKRFLKFGLPSGLQFALEGVAFTVFLIIIGQTQNGNVGLAASSIAVTLMMIAILPTLGMAQAVMIQVGQFLGEKKPELAVSATHVGAKISLIYMACISFLFFAFRDVLIKPFENTSDMELWTQVELTVPYILGCVAVFILFDSLNFNFSFALKGAGDTRFVSAVALILPWPVMMLPTFLARNEPNALQLAWTACVVYSFIQAGIFALRFKQGKWKSMSVMESHSNSSE